MVDFQLVQHLTEYVKLADQFMGEMLLATADFTMTDSDLTEKLESLMGTVKFIRDKERKKVKEDREFSRSLTSFLGERIEEDDLGIGIRTPISEPPTSEDPE
jgi:hypothetical protein